MLLFDVSGVFFGPNFDEAMTKAFTSEAILKDNDDEEKGRSGEGDDGGVMKRR